MGPVLAFGYQFPFPRSRNSREPVESVSNLQDRSPCAGIGQLPSHLPRLLGAIQPFQAFIRDRRHRVLPSSLESGPLAARPPLAIGLLTVATPQSVTRPPSRSQPRARATKTGSTPAPVRASVLWPRPWVLIEIDQYDGYAVQRGGGILGLDNWSLASPARLLFEIEIEIDIGLTPAVNRSSQKYCQPWTARRGR
jgi:hypothetical protein